MRWPRFTTITLFATTHCGACCPGDPPEPQARGAAAASTRGSAGHPVDTGIEEVIHEH
jgi:hypothetical protein